MGDKSDERSGADAPKPEISREAYATRLPKSEIPLFNKATQSERTEDAGWLSGLSKILKNENGQTPRSDRNETDGGSR